MTLIVLVFLAMASMGGGKGSTGSTPRILARGRHGGWRNDHSGPGVIAIDFER